MHVDELENVEKFLQTEYPGCDYLFIINFDKKGNRAAVMTNMQPDSLMGMISGLVDSLGNMN